MNETMEDDVGGVILVGAEMVEEGVVVVVGAVGKPENVLQEQPCKIAWALFLPVLPRTWMMHFFAEKLSVDKTKCLSTIIIVMSTNELSIDKI